MNYVKKLLDYKIENNISYSKLEKLTSLSTATLLRLFLHNFIVTDKTKFKIIRFFANLNLNDHKIFKDHATAVKYYRLILNLSQRKLAKLAGHIDHSTINSLERFNHRDTCKKKHTKSPSTILALEKIIGRQIVVRNYLPVTSKTNIIKNLMLKHFTTKRHIADKLSITWMCCNHIINRIDDEKKSNHKNIMMLAEALNVHYSIFYNYTLAKKYFN